jgi:hypothetical protein
MTEDEDSMTEPVEEGKHISYVEHHTYSLSRQRQNKAMEFVFAAFKCQRQQNKCNEHTSS